MDNRQWANKCKRSKSKLQGTCFERSDRQGRADRIGGSCVFTKREQETAEVFFSANDVLSA